MEYGILIWNCQYVYYHAHITLIKSSLFSHYVRMKSRNYQGRVQDCQRHEHEWWCPNERRSVNCKFYPNLCSVSCEPISAVDSGSGREEGGVSGCVDRFMAAPMGFKGVLSWACLRKSKTQKTHTDWRKPKNNGRVFVKNGEISALKPWNGSYNGLPMY